VDHPPSAGAENTAARRVCCSRASTARRSIARSGARRR